jgi:ribosomal protein L37AE/L43A
MNDTAAQKRHMGTGETEPYYQWWHCDRCNRAELKRIDPNTSVCTCLACEKRDAEAAPMLWSETLKMYVSIPTD